MAYTPNTYTADGSTTEFAITFPFLREADIVVSVFDASGNVVSAFDFEIFLDGSFKARVVADGTITDNTPTALPVNYTVTISRETDISTLATTFVDGVSLRAADINGLLLQQNYALQEFGRNTQEALGKNVTDTAWDATSLRITNLAQPTADNDAIRKVDVDSGIGPDITTVAGISSDVTTVAADTADIGTVATDITGTNTIGTVAGAIANVNAVSNDIANVNAVAADATDIGVVAADLSGSDTIGTVAGSIANVNTLAGNDAGGTAHLTNISDLAPQATNIDTLASGTDSGGTAYLTHLENAATNAAAAQSALEAFNRTYLGAYSADPTVDGNGDPLTDGDLYYNTTSNNLKFYDAGNTVWVTLNNSVQVNAAATLGATGDVNFSTETHQDFIMRDNSNPAKWVNVNPAGVRQAINVEDGATADQTGAEIKALYEQEANAFTDAQFTKLSNISANADVTADAGAVMEADTTTTAMQFVVDEDDMVSDSATKVPTQQSVKAYADTKQPAITTSSGTINAQALTTRVGNHEGGNVSVDVRRANGKYFESSITAITAEPGASLLNVVTPSNGTTTVTLPDTLSIGDIVSIYHNGGAGTLRVVCSSTGPNNMRINGQSSNVTNPTTTGVTLGAHTITTFTMIGNNFAIVAGSDVT